MSALRKQLYYIWKKLSERQLRQKQNNGYFKPDMERFERCTERKPVSQIKREIKALHQYWGCYPFQYYSYNLYRRDCTLSLEEMKKFIPLFFLHNLFLPLSYKEYGILCEDKLLTYATLKAYEVPQPQMLFCFDNNMFFDNANNPVTAATVDALIQGCSAEKLFIKPRFGSEGKGIAVFNKRAGQFTDEQGATLAEHFFSGNQISPVAGRDTSGFFIVQEGLRQHEELNRIYPHAINTYRFITECTNGSVRILYCVLRMGSGGRQIDNSSAGGLFVHVNKEIGILSEMAFTFDQQKVAAHPDTGFVFKGAKLETWQTTKTFALAAARKFREIKYLGWDIALTPDGPAVIEFNNRPSIGHIQHIFGGARDVFHINPKDWWYQSNYTIKNL